MRTMWIGAAIVAAGCGIGGCSSGGAGGGGGGGGGADAAKLVTGFEESVNVVGKTPPGWTTGENHGVGKPASWIVDKDPTAPRDPHVVTVRTENPEPTFNWCVADASSFRDVEVGVLVKPLSGNDDQGGGVMLRFQDAKNYYLARWNPIEFNVRFYHVKNDVRTKIGDIEMRATPGWRRIVVRAKGSHFEVWFDGSKVIEVDDDTFPGAGKVGLWSKADAITSFDDFSAVSL
jgi:hypothetical protein